MDFAALVTSIQKCSDIILSWLPYIKNNKEAAEIKQLIDNANSLVKALQFDEALDAYAEIAKKFPKDIRPRLGQIHVLRKQDQHLEAIALCGVALELSGTPEREARVYQTMGMIASELFETHWRLVDIQAAIEFFKKGKALNHSDMVIVSNLAESYAKAALRASAVTSEQKEKFIDLSISEIRYAKELVSRHDCDERRRKNAVMFVNGVSQEEDLMSVTSIKEGISELAAAIEVSKPDLVSAAPEFSILRKAAKGFAILAVATSLIGVQAPSADAHGHLSPPQSQIELVDTTTSGGTVSYSDAWQVGLQVYDLSFDAQECIDLKPVAEINDWHALKIQEYDIDEMTS